jgi:hypothetical protein
MYHFETKPPVGGTPIMLRAPMVKAVMVQGMRRPMPRSWCSSVFLDGGVDGAGGEEQRDLAEGVRHHVHGRAHLGQRLEHRGAITT